MEKETLLIVGGGEETVPGVKIAKNMGLHVVVSDRNPNAPAFEFADDHLVASTYDYTETFIVAHTYHHQNRHIDGVISIGVDVPVTVARVAYGLNLPHIPIRAATTCANKYRMFSLFKTNSIPTPETYMVYHELIDNKTKLVDNKDGAVVAYYRSNLSICDDGLWVMKPVDACGARGVMRILPHMDKELAYTRALQYSKSGQVIIQRWLDGPQVSTEGIVYKHKYYHVASVDRNYARLEEFSPYIIEDGGSQPSVLPQDDLHKITGLMQRVADVLGIENGTLKGDIVFHEHEPYIIEVAPRLSGGYMSTIQIPLATGVQIVEHAIDLCLGRKVNPERFIPQMINAVAIRYEFPRAPQFHGERGRHAISTGRTVQEAIQKAEQWVI